MSEFDHCEPFGIDDGSLDGFSETECFTLGVEWEMVRHRIKTQEGFTAAIHVVNRSRIEDMLAREGRRFTLTHMDDDLSESWMYLVVYPEE
jgi:hypothetical protein